MADDRLRDEDISTTWKQTTGSGAGLTADPDGTDGDTTDGTDGDTTDGTDGDSGDPGDSDSQDS